MSETERLHALKTRASATNTIRHGNSSKVGSTPIRSNSRCGRRKARFTRQMHPRVPEIDLLACELLSNDKKSGVSEIQQLPQT